LKQFILIVKHKNEKTWNIILKTAESWLKSWPDKPLNEGKNILDILKFENTSLWWFVYDVLWENKNGVFDTIYQVETLRSLLDEFNPKRVNIDGKFEFPIAQMLSSLSGKHGFKISDHSHKALTSQNEGIISKKRINFIVKLFILKFIHLFAKRKKRRVFIFSTHGGVIDKTKQGDKISVDQYFVGLEDFFEKNRKIINFVSFNKNLSSKKFSEMFSSTLNGKYDPWVIYYSFRGILKAYKESKKFKKLILKIENNSDFIKSMTINGVNVFPFLRNQIIVNLPFLVGYAYLELEATKQFLSKNDPSIVFSVDGFGVAGRALNYVCKKNKKRVMTPQLGIISSEFPVNTAFFIVKKYDMNLLPEVLTWGKYFEDLIEKRGYPKKFIKNVGFWKTSTEDQVKNNEDYIFYIAGANQIKLEYILSLEEEIFTIQSIHDSLPNGVKLMVKLHPNLNEKPYFEKLKSLKNIILIGSKETVDVNDLVSHSKMIIGKASTIFIQAMILDKPVIAVNFSGNTNFLGFKEIPFVTNIEDLKNIIDEIFQGKLQNKYKINDYCNPIGKEAVSNVINELMNS